MPYRIVLMTYLHRVNATWKASLLTKLTTVEIEELLIDEILSEGDIKQLWDRITFRATSDNCVYTKMLERIYLTKKDHIVNICV